MRPRLAEPVALEQLAEVAVMSPYHFVRTFRRVTGVPPMQFLAALRVEAAKRRLLATERSILDVCFGVGYNSLGTFTRRFTELVGLSPGRFRHLARTFYPDLDSLLAVASSCPLPADGRRIRGRAVRTDPNQVIFVGLFDKRIPQGRPLSCAVLLAGNEVFELGVTGTGELHLFAMAMGADSSPIDLLVGGEAVRAVAHAGPLDPDSKEPLPGQRLVLAPLKPIDPPMLLALPLLLHERVMDMGRDDVAGVGDHP